VSPPEQRNHPGSPGNAAPVIAWPSGGGALAVIRTARELPAEPARPRASLAEIDGSGMLELPTAMRV